MTLSISAADRAVKPTARRSRNQAHSGQPCSATRCFVATLACRRLNVCQHVLSAAGALTYRMAMPFADDRHPLMQYDTDVVTWSPQGRIHQIEYAMEAVKQGAAAVGLKVRRATAVVSSASSETGTGP